MMQQAPGLAARSPLSYRMGIDIGSVTAKVVVLGPQDEMIFSAYRRHRAEISATLCSILQEASESLGDVACQPDDHRIGRHGGQRTLRHPLHPGDDRVG